MKSCSFCYQSDLDDRAIKCPHCGAWIDGEKHKSGEFNELRRELLVELRENKKEYQDYMSSVFNRVQFAATIILAIVVGASAWFGFRTDTSITDIKDEITSRIEAEFHTKKSQDLLEQITSEKAKEAADIANAKVSSETEDLLKKLNMSVAGAQNKVTVSAQNAEKKLAATLTKIESLDEKLGPAQARLNRIEKTAQATNDAIVNAAQAPVQKATLPAEPISMGPKGGLREIPELLERRPQALSFKLGLGHYFGPVIWKYLDNLIDSPGFRLVVITSKDSDSLFGLFDAPSLIAYLNPPNAKELSDRFPLSINSAPVKDEVPRWTKFAELVSRGNREDQKKLASLPGFVAETQAVDSAEDKRQVLQHMQETRVDWLPVVEGPRRRFVGIVDRSRLTASLLLEIASGVKAR